MRRGRRRIAMFDSGLGGLTVLTALRRRIPDADIYYAADTARVPYGDRPLEQVESFAQQMIARLRAYDPDLLIVACGTSCSAFDRSGYRVPDLATLEIVNCGVRAAATVGEPNIGVIATTSTVNSGIFERHLKAALPAASVVSVAAPRLVPLVETGRYDTDEAARAVEEYCQPFLRSGSKTVVLGCTHFPLLVRWFERTLGPGARILDPAIECAALASQMLQEAEPGDASLTFEVSGNEGSFADAVFSLTGLRPTAIRRVDFSAAPSLRAST